jgi:recombination DNA repair RAD52 pathway protein
MYLTNLLSSAPNNTQQSSAEVIRDFVSDRQDDFEYELNQNNPDATISTSGKHNIHLTHKRALDLALTINIKLVTAKESDAALKGVIPIPVAPVAEPISAPLDDNGPIEQQQNSTTPRSSIVSSVQRSHVSCAWLLLALSALAL